MKYVCLCYEEEKKLKEMPNEEWEGIVREVHTYNEELRQKGCLITSQPLDFVEKATTVRVRKGKVWTTDGPFAETKEQLGGFYLIEARDINEAIQVASKFPGARVGCIEVRPTVELS
jgi:hypothetical protein